MSENRNERRTRAVYGENDDRPVYDAVREGEAYDAPRASAQVRRASQRSDDRIPYNEETSRVSAGEGMRTVRQGQGVTASRPASASRPARRATDDADSAATARRTASYGNTDAARASRSAANQASSFRTARDPATTGGVSSRPAGQTAQVGAPRPARRASSTYDDPYAEAPSRPSSRQSAPSYEEAAPRTRRPSTTSYNDTSVNEPSRAARRDAPAYDESSPQTPRRAAIRTGSAAGDAARAAATGVRRDAPQPDEAQPRRATAREARPTASRVSERYGSERARQTRAYAADAPLKRFRLFERVPEWAQLGVIALVILVLIGVTMRLITTSGTKTDRTVIMPIVSATAQPSDAPQEVVSAAVTADPNASVAVETAPTTDAPSSETPAGTAEPAGENGNGEENASANGGEATAPLVTPAPVTSAPVAASVPEGQRRSATIRMAGDIIMDTEMLEYSYNKVTDTYDFSPYFEYIGDTLSSPDYTMINIEATLRRGKYGYAGYPQFSTPPVILQTLKSLGCDMITMCNNHMLDGYCDGLVESVGYVDAVGLDHIGGFLDETDAAQAEVYEINGIKVGFVTYTQVTNSMENLCDDRYKVLVKYLKNAAFEADVARCRAAGAEVVVAVTHWGEEYKSEPESQTRKYAEQLVAAGADIIIGGHPHMVQPAEYITATDSSGRTRTALCLYSLGNFLSQHYKVKDTDGGIVLQFTLSENADGTISVTDIGYVPVFMWRWRATDANGRVRSSSDGDPIWELRVIPIAPYLENRPESMDDDNYNRMTEYYNTVTTLMGGYDVITLLPQ